ncbi:MAG: glycogen/starch/alpha-glucan phosphorylase [Candidatus Schekmanbacteria bacterium]|nr:glycogen/starch/alpha-glucan phosphorylase [Candidatus Schekmanbacteria bacterium]
MTAFRTATTTAAADSNRTGLSVEALARGFLDNLYYLQARFPPIATTNDYYLALAYTVRDRLLRHWIRTAETYFERASRTVCYLSAEYLLGPHLGKNLINMGIEKQVRQAVAQLGLGIDLEALLEREEEPGLGNGGLGRLAACYLDSLATLEIPTIGYGIRYEFGIFDQEIRDGWQLEVTDKWLQLGNPWEIPRPEIAYNIGFGGGTETYTAGDGRQRVRWVPAHAVRGIGYDTPQLGYRVNTANMLRLWSAQACESFDFEAFNVGDYYGAVEEKLISENLTKVLYPNDEPIQGKVLRLEQQYFFASCSLQDMIRIHLQRAHNLDDFHLKYVVQLNDTHPSIAIAELMRLLVDEHDYAWETAWDITRRTFAYTNHTLLPEALERWPLPLFASHLPRHLEIIYEINRRFLDEVRARYPGDDARAARLSLIDESGQRFVRMAHLACAGSHAVNGVSALHTELLKRRTMKDFHELWPQKLTNITNGVTPRRFMVLANPGLSRLICDAIGDGWIKDLEQLRRLEPLADDPAFREEFRRVKVACKRNLAEFARRSMDTEISAESLFDIQVKRIHEYKRQHLNVLHILTLYNEMKRRPQDDFVSRTFFFGGKAAPGYRMAKLIIKLINSVAEIINSDADVAGRLRVSFIPDFNVKTGQRIYPAADLSEQISLAGTEASGTGNMKLALNGALTIGTLDGANIEIRAAVGENNFYLFGLTAEQVEVTRARGYHPGEIADGDARLREILTQLRNGVFSGGDKHLFAPLVDDLRTRDPYLVLADFDDYVACQQRVSAAFRDVEAWTRTAILTVARMGWFSSDRAIREYCERIWKVEPVSVTLELL